MAYGEDVPTPSLPSELSKMKPGRPALPKRMVEEACRPPVRSRAVEVLLAWTPKEVVGSNGKAKPVVEPHEAPVLDMRPMELKVAQPGVPPALETTRFVVEATFDTESDVVVALVVVELSAVKFCRVVEALARSCWKLETKVVEVAVM
jgi:hypothetical protein